MGRKKNIWIGITVVPASVRFLALTAIIFLSGGISFAEGISGYLDLTYSKVSLKTEDAVGIATNARSDSFLQRYSITLDKRLYPNLSLLAGGLFERNISAVETGGQEIDITQTRIKPYVSLRLRTPLYNVDGGYDRNETEVKTSGSAPATTVNENYYTSLGWRPDGFPDMKLQFFRTNTFDKDRRFQDVTSESFLLTSTYRPINPLFLKYTGALNENSDRLEQSEVRTTSHEGRITYSDQWWKRRAAISSSYDVTYQGTEVATSGIGEVRFMLSPIFGLSAITDTPGDVVLTPTPALIDGNLTTGVGINLGLPPPGGNSRPRNFGLDFVNDTEVNTLMVWVDRDLPPDIANSFSWEIYSSADNKTWVFRQAVSPAVFGPFLTRFEIDFTAVTTRYVKVVVRPLSPAVLQATGFPDISVTEIQAFVRRSAAAAQGKTSQTSHRYNLDARVRLMDAPSLYYEMSYFLVKTTPNPSRYDLSNGLSFSHMFGRVFSTFARLAREDGHQPNGNRVSYVYTASVTATPLDTLRHTLVYSGRTEKFGDEKTDTNAISLLNTAQLYRGIDVTLGAGGSLETRETGEKTESTQINVGLTLVPHPTLTINLSYLDSTRDLSGGARTTETRDSARTSDASVAYNPVATLYLFASYRMEERTGLEKQSVVNYSANWSPFPDGALHLNFNYSETLQTEVNERTRTITPSARWNITRKSYLDLSYQDQKTDSILQKTRNEVASGNLHVSF